MKGKQEIWIKLNALKIKYENGKVLIANEDSKER